jgi:hypothetical protein
MDQKQKKLYYKLMTDCGALIPECPNEKAGKRVLACEYCRCDYLVKHTAKEIIAMFDDRNYISEMDLKKAIAERYGVGVEE